MDYDKILTELGEFGPWQINISILMWLPAIIDGMMTMTASYSALAPNVFRCNIPDCDGPQFGYDDFATEKLFPSFDIASLEYKPDKPDYCSYYEPRVLDNGTCLFSSDDIVTCNSDSTFTYDQDTFVMKSTLVTEFSMFCDESKLLWIPLFNSCFMIGLGIGSLMFGIISDNFGRRNTLLMAIIIGSAASAGGSFMPNYWSYALLRILVGVGSEGCFIVAFIMSMEIVGVKEHVPGLPWVSYNTFQGSIISVPFALGEVFVSLIAMVVIKWRDLELALSILSMTCAVIWFFIPESPRWLIAKRNYIKAREVIREAALKNDVMLSGDLFTGDADSEEVEEITHYRIFDIFHKSVLKISLAMFVCWPVATLLYYGLTFSADKIQLTDNTHVSFIIMALVEIPSVMVLILLMDVWGRKPLFVFSLLIPGVSCVAAAWLEKGVIFTIFVLIGKFCASGALSIAYIFTAELFPTSIRTTMIGSCSTMARVGGILAPWVAVYLPDQGSFNKQIPLYVFGATSVLGGMMALLLPETLGFPLPNTFQDVEIMKMKGKGMFSCVDPRQAARKDKYEQSI